MRKLVVLGALVALCVPSAVSARVVSNTFNPQAELVRQGERVRVKVLLGCDRTQPAKLRVTLTQGSHQDADRGWGTGQKQVACEKERGEFRVRVKARQKRAFDSGRATACALAITDDDAVQWCKEVRLRAS